jgi:hypothetical protein
MNGRKWSWTNRGTILEKLMLTKTLGEFFPSVQSPDLKLPGGMKYAILPHDAVLEILNLFR